MKSEEALTLATSALDELAAALQEGKSQTLTQFLEIMARFPRYSFRNVMLIAAQRPDATRVAGFSAWRQLGRQVLKGERGIAIVAPMVGRKRSADERHDSHVLAETADDKLFGFRIVHVFDISQTAGDEIPDLARPQGEPGDCLRRLEEAVTRLGIALEYAPLPGGSLGWSLKGAIIVQPGLEPAETFAVLAHELAHELLHKPSDRPKPSKTVRETEAEGVAHAVCHAFGIDTRKSSSDYIQLYAGGTEALSQSLQAIQTTAAQIIVEMSRDIVATLVATDTTLAA
jgi:hypothetical protein